MITEVYIKNYRSIVEATVKLSPFTLLIGANGTGKSNFLFMLSDIAHSRFPLVRHLNYHNKEQEIICTRNNGDALTIKLRAGAMPDEYTKKGQFLDQYNTRIFSINPAQIGYPENLTSNPMVYQNGSGAVQVLDALKTGDREDLFDEIERVLGVIFPKSKN